MRRLRSAIVGLVLVLVACRLPATGSGEDGARAVVDARHTGAILGLEYDPGRDMLFSAGEDGTVRIWNASSGALLRTLEVTRLDATRIAVDPQSPLVAVVVTDQTGSWFLSVWNWETERQVYRLALAEDPLFVRFSDGGTYLLYGESSWQGLRIVNAASGTPVSFHPEGFGIVGYAAMPSDEKTLLTYLVSGRLLSWDMASGAQTLSLPSVPFLSGLRISRDGRSLAGGTGKEVVIIDAATGAARARAAAPNVASLDLSPAGDRLTCVVPGARGLSAWALSGSALAPAAMPASTLRSPTLLCSGSSSLFLANAGGALVAELGGGGEIAFGSAPLAGLTGFAVSRGTLAVAAPGLVRVFQSDALDGAAPPSSLTSALVANPLEAPTLLAPLSDGRVLAWSTDTGSPGMAVIDMPPAAKMTAIRTGFHAPIVDLRPVGDLVLGVETGGQVRLTELATGASRFETRVPGAGTVVSSSPAEIVAGRTSTADSTGSLLRIDMRTGETVAIRDRNLYTYALAFDSGEGRPVLYTIGVDSAVATNLIRHDGSGFERASLLGTVGEEDLDVSAAVDPVTHRLYATLGLDSLVAGDGTHVQPLALGNTSPVHLAARGGLLFSLTKAGTVSVADGATGERLAEVSVFSDGEWAIIFRDGHYAASPGGDIHVRVFVEGEPVKATEDYRLRLESH